ncbi:MAG: Spy/CpxP family protein refolding chaperone [Pyrinomonadaceae bacterium]|nr:Spy/CpxP family protein refolding chaperone [Pyrinomonadaceae bacterium]
MRKSLKMFFLLSLIMFGAATAITAQVHPTVAGESEANRAVAAYPLSEAQKQKIKFIRSEAEKTAAPLALRLAQVAKRIYENMLAEKPDEELRQRLSSEMNEVVVALLSIKGQSMRDAVNALTAEQKQVIRSEMRKPGAPGDLMELIMRVFNLPEK